MHPIGEPNLVSPAAQSFYPQGKTAAISSLSPALQQKSLPTAHFFACTAAWGWYNAAVFASGGKQPCFGAK